MRFGHESEPSKEQSPRLSCELLGVTLDLPAGRMRLAARKRESYASAVRAVAGLRVCPRADYESLMGKLTFASLCYPMGRQWLHAPWRAARAAFRTAGDAVAVGKSVRESPRCRAPSASPAPTPSGPGGRCSRSRHQGTWRRW